MTSTLTEHCKWEVETVRERTGHPPSYNEAKKMKSPTLHTHGLIFFFFYACFVLLTTRDYFSLCTCVVVIIAAHFVHQKTRYKAHSSFRLQSKSTLCCKECLCCNEWAANTLPPNDQGHREFPFCRWQIPGPLLEKSKQFPFRINDLFTCKHVHYCQKVTETDSFLSTAQNSIVIIFIFTGQSCMRETKLVSLVQLYLCCHSYNRAPENSRFESDKFPFLFWKNPENSRFRISS